MRDVYDKTGRNGVCDKAARNAPVEFVQRIEKGSGEKNKALVLPSPDFQRLCVEQLDLFRRIFNHDAVLSPPFEFEGLPLLSDSPPGYWSAGLQYSPRPTTRS